jgi:hypothetical protein
MGRAPFSAPQIGFGDPKVQAPASAPSIQLSWLGVRISGARRWRLGACDLRISKSFGVSSLRFENTYHNDVGTYHTNGIVKRDLSNFFTIKFRARLNKNKTLFNL